VYTGIHNEQEEGKDHGKYHHRTGSDKQSKNIKYCDDHINLPLTLQLKQKEETQCKPV
jgi:hypothetical protein